MKKLFNFPLILGMFLCLLGMAGSAWGATYYKRSNGTAANKEAATGPCTTVANCMNRTVYAGETFAEGDVIVNCHTLIDDGLDEFFRDISRTLSLVPDKALKTSNGNYFKVGGGYFIVQ